VTNEREVGPERRREGGEEEHLESEESASQTLQPDEGEIAGGVRIVQWKSRSTEADAGQKEARGGFSRTCLDEAASEECPGDAGTEIDRNEGRTEVFRNVGTPEREEA
jgi:hypothetical protein